EIENRLRDLGFRVKRGTHARDRYGYLAGKDEDRASDLNDAFSDPEVDAVIPYRGGWGSNRILDRIDYDLIARNPKPLIGFSDITSLLLAIHSRTGLVTFHGPVGKSEWTEFTVRHFEAVLMKAGVPALLNPPGETIETITPGNVAGPLLGGNLTVLTSMLGSGYLPDFENAILFLEDVGEDIYRIDRMLTQLKLNGILDRIGGFVFGKCIDCTTGSGYSLTLEQVFSDHIAPLGIPAFRGTMVGHIDDMYTLPIGIPARIDAGTGAIEILEPAVK
ncbi:MAG: LD-carboxypeptidase, partial [Balneolaceae bacterium]|nr:LD-carboxypeptidase [Balneolaceae bacterium]